MQVLDTLSLAHVSSNDLAFQLTPRYAGLQYGGGGD